MFELYLKTHLGSTYLNLSASSGQINNDQFAEYKKSRMFNSACAFSLTA